MGLMGIAASFLPQEILTLIGLEPTYPLPLVLQVMGALYFAFAMTNWFAKDNLIGGIYGKPIAIGNFAHFVIAALALIKGIPIDSNSIMLWSAAAVYIIFAVLFGYIAFANPVKRDDAI